MFGNVLENNVHKLKNASLNKKSKDAFWKILRNIAVEELKEYSPEKIDSSCAIDVYYEILKRNESYIPDHFKQKCKSNNQERYRVINRNLWSSNNNIPEGLSNQPGIRTKRQINENKCGNKTIYWWEEKNDIK